MKKRVLFKRVCVLGVMLLLVNVVLPGINAHAYSDETWMWDYVRNKATWDNSATNGALKVYYANNPGEDLWCTDNSNGHKATWDDVVYSALICSDSQCIESTNANLTTIHGNDYQLVSYGPNSYYLINDAVVGNDEIYPLYISINHCSLLDGDLPEGATIPQSWLDEGLCQYMHDAVVINSECTLPDDAPDGAEVNPYANADWCVYNVYGEIVPELSNSYVKLISYSYPSSCQPTYQGWLANGAQSPWISVAFNQEFRGIIKFNYSDYQDGVDVYPRGTGIKSWGPVGKAWGEASIPGEFGNEYLVTSGGTTAFDLDKFSATLLVAHTVTFQGNNGEVATTGEVLSGEVISQPTNPVRNGYNFAGWYVDEGLTTTYDFSIPVTSDMTLYAKWAQKISGGSSGGGGTTTSSQNQESVTTVSNQEESENFEIDSQLIDVENQDWYEKGNQKEVMDNGLSRELNNAYEFAFRAGITTMKSAKEADMNGTLNRIAMAKMLSQYAINVLGKKPDTSKNPKFGDVTSNLDSEYDNGVTLAYQLGIMGVGITEFRPYDEVPRSEFVTALSRMLYGLADGSDKYYSTHMSKLQKEGIITNINPTLQELRGYVMLMLMRSTKIDNTVNDNIEGVVSDLNIDESENKPLDELKPEQEVERYFTEAYRRGQIYGRIGDLQKLLQYLGFYNGDINNTFDSSTIDAVFDFQVAMGILEANDTSVSRGNVGPKTRDILNQKWAEYKSSK